MPRYVCRESQFPPEPDDSVIEAESPTVAAVAFALPMVEEGAVAPEEEIKIDVTDEDGRSVAIRMHFVVAVVVNGETYLIEKPKETP